MTAPAADDDEKLIAWQKRAEQWTSQEEAEELIRELLAALAALEAPPPAEPSANKTRTYFLVDEAGRKLTGLLNSAPAPDLCARLRDASLSCSKGQRGDIHLEAAAALEAAREDRDAFNRKFSETQDAYGRLSDLWQAAEARCAELEREIATLTADRAEFARRNAELWKRDQAAEARCAELERDAARLDWLDRDDITLHFATRHGSPIVEVHRADTGELIAMRDTLRAAIDAARAK